MSENLSRLKFETVQAIESSEMGISDEEDEDIDDLKDLKGANNEFAKDSKLTQEIIDKRREQNRVLARRTRQRKKSFFESLQKQASDLVKENEILKDLVKNKKAEENYSENYPNSPRLPISTPFGNANVVSNLSRDDYRLLAAIQSGQRSFVITNPALPDNPIVFANQGFHDLTGYSPSQAIGRNCRFLQGPGTSRRHVDIMRQGISTGDDTKVYVLNYRIDGRPFYNHVFIAALRDTNQRIAYYVGLHVEVSEEEARSNENTEDTGLFDSLGDQSWRTPVLSGSVTLSSVAFAPPHLGDTSSLQPIVSSGGITYNNNDSNINNANDKEDCMSDFDFDEFMEGSL